MLIGESGPYVQVSFDDEAEIERVVQEQSDLLFGWGSVFLPKRLISTSGGRGTIPDGFVINLESGKWYIVEAELGSHGTWEHIAPQVSRQITAVANVESREKVVQLALGVLRDSPEKLHLLTELGIDEMAVHGRLQTILQEPPIVAIPIDDVPADLRQWAETLRTPVLVWEIHKYIRESDGDVLYDLPDEFAPSIDTTADDTKGSVRRRPTDLWQSVLRHRLLQVGEELYLEYGPQGEVKRRFSGIVRPEGIDVDGRTYSPSYAAVRCMRSVGSRRRTTNGWTMWRKADGISIDRLVPQLPSEADSTSE